MAQRTQDASLRSEKPTTVYCHNCGTTLECGHQDMLAALKAIEPWMFKVSDVHPSARQARELVSRAIANAEAPAR